MQDPKQLDFYACAPRVKTTSSTEVFQFAHFDFFFFLFLM